MPTEADDPQTPAAEPSLVGGDYNVLPYRSVPYQHTQPPHLAAIARLFGIDAPDPATARTLEFGCASGGNIIPLAARFPNASFLGIDLSERQVADGQARIKALGLTNIEIRHGDIAAIDLSGETFDYSICHGVYSWIPFETQEAVFRITAETLSKNGVCYVSYNTYPGWHLRTIVRDICLYHAGKTGTPELRVARARWALNQLANLSKDTTPHGQLLRNEAKLNAKLPDSYILGEFLATHNSPCFFHEFVARASKHGLKFLSETDFASSVPEALDKEMAKLVRQIAGKSGVALEQYMDFFVGRQFRRSLLVRNSGDPTRQVGPERIRDLNFSTGLRHDAAASTDGKTVFKSERGGLNVTDPSLRKMLDYLQASFPETRTLDELVERVAPPGAAAEPKLVNAVLATLFNLLASGHVEVSVVPLRVGHARDASPKVWPLARLEAASGQPWVSSQRHAPIGLEKGISGLVAVIDGVRDRNDIAAMVLDNILDGSLPVKGLNLNQQTSREQLQPVADRVLERLMVYLERNALLQPGV